MWIKHKGDRSSLLNFNAFEEAKQKGREIVFITQGRVKIFEYEDEAEALQAFGYLLEAAKKGYDMVHI